MARIRFLIIVLCIVLHVGCLFSRVSNGYDHKIVLEKSLVGCIGQIRLCIMDCEGTFEPIEKTIKIRQDDSSTLGESDTIYQKRYTCKQDCVNKDLC